MAIEFSSIVGCGDTKMTYLRMMCDKNNIKVKITSNIGKQDTISCRFQKGTTEVCLDMPSNDFLSDTKATERRLVMLIYWAFNVKADSVRNAILTFQAVEDAQKGEFDGK